jgi:hypothetical protein
MPWESLEIRGLYRLAGRDVVPEPSFMEWAAWRGHADCTVRRTNVSKPGMSHPTLISTVFIGVDLGCKDGELPLVFETMIFVGGRASGSQWRRSTWEDAEACHDDAVAMATAAAMATGSEGVEVHDVPSPSSGQSGPTA